MQRAPDDWVDAPVSLKPLIERLDDAKAVAAAGGSIAEIMAKGVSRHTAECFYSKAHPAWRSPRLKRNRLED